MKAKTTCPIAHTGNKCFQHIPWTIMAGTQTLHFVLMYTSANVII